jgi:amino-acid N-acetyltransferase
VSAAPTRDGGTGEGAAIEIRPAALKDLSAVRAVLRPFVEHRTILRRTRDEVAEMLATSFVAVRAGRVIGFAALDIYSRKLAEIRGLVVADEFQGRGVGKRLVEACVALAHDRDVMEVLAITSSEAFFRSCGFDFTLPDEKKAMFRRTRERH